MQSEDLRAAADPAEFQKQLKTLFTTAHNVYWSWNLCFYDYPCL